MDTNTRAACAELNATLNLQRKAALMRGGAVDHAGRVQVQRMLDFDMGRTIFAGLGGIARKIMDEKLAKEAVWDPAVAADIEAAYAQAESAQPAPAIDERLIRFMVEECDFSMEHADGTFLEHLVFCHHYAARYIAITCGQSSGVYTYAAYAESRNTTQFSGDLHAIHVVRHRSFT